MGDFDVTHAPVSAQFQGEALGVIPQVVEIG